MAFRPSASLRSRTFVGLLIAQFLAAFNDQAIHAAAMFFAFHQRLLNEKQAISLMPILFYAPWAIFCTLAGYLADRFSKRHSLVFWKMAEIGICLIALMGFYLGDHGHVRAGPMLVLGCVFLMGMHSAFFVPAKYGVMPEILQPQILSRGNGLLESLSFLAVILGTVCGGVLSYTFKGDETWIGVVLLGIALVGAFSSLLMEKMPAANPGRKFPPYLYGPLKESLRSLFSARPLALAVVGIAFFTFVVAFMRQTVYMLGECQTPRWTESQTSYIVGSTAFGIGLGSPLAGWLSGRKIELGLVPLGGLGMVLAALLATVFLHWVPGLVIGIVTIGFFTGFYLVPLYTLLQHRAPKSSKGDAVAISNFINVTGAILASVMFFFLVSSFQKMGLAKPIPFGDEVELTLAEPPTEHDGRVIRYTTEERGVVEASKKTVIWAPVRLPTEIDPEDNLPTVIERRAELRQMTHILVYPQGTEPEAIYDNSGLPSFLFIGAAVITALILLGLILIQPDLPKRALWAIRRLAGPRVRAIGSHHVPLRGTIVLATNCRSADDCKYLRSASDRLIDFIGPTTDRPGGDLTGWAKQAEESLRTGRLVALTEGALPALGLIPGAGEMLAAHVGPSGREVRVSFGAPTPVDPSAVAEALRAAAVAEDDYHGH